MKSGNTDKLFETIADSHKNNIDVLLNLKDKKEHLMPVDDLKKKWEEVNEKLKDTDKMSHADYLIKNSNDFYFASMYLKAKMRVDVNRRDSILSSITYDNSAGSDNSFIRKEYKELKKRLAL